MVGFTLFYYTYSTWEGKSGKDGEHRVLSWQGDVTYLALYTFQDPG